MSNPMTREMVSEFNQPLENHPIYQALQTIEDLQCFMEHHVFAVWDFMSLLKYLQSVIAPGGAPWSHAGDPNVRRFINELVLEEESDEALEAGEYISHFELYQQAMLEVGADLSLSSRFVSMAQESGVSQALALAEIPEAARRFTAKTFEFIQSDQAHQVAAALAIGREQIIPGMFRSILQKSGISEQQAAAFRYYLQRHIHLDEGTHGPLSLRLLNQLCEDDPVKQEQALEAGRQAVHARMEFWDGVLEAMRKRSSVESSTALNTATA
ncbi:MAG: DUF3050 domain-containing protein [Gammaproteobacteria bacterium]|nr:DUF3050 domain-containing protein [Gammaproteobacteria bacterium]